MLKAHHNGNGHKVDAAMFMPLAGTLRARGVRVILNCRMERETHDSNRFGSRMKELRITAPALALHRIHSERRMVIGIGSSIECWRADLYCRGINLISVSAEGLINNPEGIADAVCKHIYRIDPEDLLDMVQKKMPLAAITAFTGIEAAELQRIIPRFYGKTIHELRAMAG